MAYDSKAPVVEIPDAPQHLSSAAKREWRERYAKAHAQARVDHPENLNAQRAAANKAANAMLAVPAPASAEEIDKLEDWQVLKRETRSQKNGGATRVCVTSDGKKYAHPVVEAPSAPEGAAAAGAK